MANVSQILSNRRNKFLFSVLPSVSVFDALVIMSENNVGSVLVLNELSQMVGIMTERDYARKVILQGRNSTDTLVNDIMTPVEKIISVTLNTSIEDCLQKMSSSHIRHLPVLEDGKPVNVISIGDVVSMVINQQAYTIQAMNDYIKGM
jgi:CBS domain-containing protein